MLAQQGSDTHLGEAGVPSQDPTDFADKSTTRRDGATAPLKNTKPIDQPNWLYKADHVLWARNVTPLLQWWHEQAACFTLSGDECWPCDEADKWNSASFKERMRRFRGSVAFSGDGKQWNCGWDTFSTTGLIQDASVPSDAIWLSREKSELIGVGGLRTETAGVIRLTLDLICNGVSRTMDLKVAKTPRMVDILFGLPQITEFDAVIRCRTQRIYLLDEIETVFTDFLHKIYARSRARALRVLSSCDGAATLSIMLRTAGWKIEKYRAVECDSLVRSVAKSNFGAIVHVQPLVIPRLGPEKSDLMALCWPRGLGTVARGS